MGDSNERGLAQQITICVVLRVGIYLFYKESDVSESVCVPRGNEAKIMSKDCERML